MIDSKVRDIIIRAVKTFWQAALASLLVAIPEIINLIPNGWDAIRPVLLSAGVGALAAGLSAVWNGVLAPVIEKLKYKQAVEIEAVENGGESSIDEK
jgi:phage-related protein